ncbi:MAG: DUF3999 domain-containing protein [Planctomycetia bacterium]|nr:DUF3999 domain-containing protein [Planctomycetia bacterium]
MTRSILYAASLTTLTLLAGVCPATAQESARYRFVKPIILGGDRADLGDFLQRDEIVGVRLDSEVYGATRDGLPDLRVLDAAGTQAPYQIERVVETRDEQVRQTGTVDIVSLDEHDGAIDIRLRLPNDAPAAEGFSFATPLTDFVRKVQISGSNDGKTWTTLVTDGMIFDYSRYIDVREHALALPKNSFRQFKVSIANVTDEKEFPYKQLARTFRAGKEEQRVEQTEVERRPLRIDRITTWHTVMERRASIPKVAAFPVSDFNLEQNAKNKQTIVHVRTRREPLTSLTLQTTAHNFYRHAVVEIPIRHETMDRGETKVSIEWQPIGQADVWNFNFRGDHREQLKIALPEQRHAEYRIVIDNEDNPPLEFQGALAEGPVYRVVFLAEAGKTYRVYYGSPSAAAPRYDAAAVLGALRGEDRAAMASLLGSWENNPSFKKDPPPTEPSFLNSWYFMGGAITLMVAVLGWGLFRAGRRLEGMAEE